VKLIHPEHASAPQFRERFAREVLAGRADDDGTVEIPMRASCWRADRVSR